MGWMRLKSQTGQSSVFAALLCSVLVMLIAMTTNIGKLVTEKIAMQNTVDMAAYSGAATQAAYLNKMRETNEKIYNQIHDLRDFLDTHSVPLDPVTYASNHPGSGNRGGRMGSSPGSLDGFPCLSQVARPNGLVAPVAEAKIQATQTTIDGLWAQFLRYANQADAAATQAAADSAQKNYPGTQGKLHFYHSGGKIADYDQALVQVSYKAWCLSPIGVPVQATFAFRQPSNEIPTTWGFKTGKKGDIQFAVGIVDAHPMSSFMSSYFDSMDGCHMGGSPNNMERCPLDVYAVATPYYGKVGADPEGRDARGERQNKRNYNKHPQGDIPEQAGDLDPEEPQGGPFKDYKVRFIGIFDDQLNYVDDGSQAEERMPSVVVNRVRH